LDAVQRLHVMSETLQAPLYATAYFAGSPAAVWAIAGDLPGELPRWIRTIRSFDFVGPAAPPAARTTRQAVLVSRIGHRAKFDVVLEPGWCLMQSRFVIGGMAAVPEGDGTRFAVLGGVRGPFGLARRLLFEPFGGASARRMLGNLARLVADRADGPAQADRP
jgi:polyketide cyclase/dehydrase/lipid transport protein